MTKKKTNNKFKNIIIIFFTFVAATVVFFVDSHFDGKIFSFIADNSFFKIIAIFFTIGGLVSLFLPFSFRADISTTDISEISSQTYEQKKEADERNERIKRQSRF